MPEKNIRPLEEGIERDLRGLNYASYLHLDELLGAQQPLSDHHDEMLFIIVHHTTELWIKLVIHEVRSAMALIAADQLAPALKRLARVKHVQRQMLHHLREHELAQVHPYLPRAARPQDDPVPRRRRGSNRQLALNVGTLLTVETKIPIYAPRCCSSGGSHRALRRSVASLSLRWLEAKNRNPREK